MHNSQLIKTLRTFSKEELSSFNDFIYSPFFNKSKTVHKLWEELKKYYPDFENPALEKEKMFNTIFNGKEYNYGTMKNLIHSVTTLAEKFLEIYFHEQDKFQHDYNTLVYCIVKYYPEMFNKKFAKTMKDFDDSKEGMDFHYLYKYQLTRLGASFAGLESKRDTILYEQGESLIYFSLIHLFQVMHNMRILDNENHNRENNLTKEFIEGIDIEAFLEKVKKFSPKHYKVVSIYYYMYLCRKEPENDHYFNTFKDLVVGSKDFLHEYEFGAIANCVSNFVIEREYKGIKGSMKDAAEYQQFLIDTKFFMGETDSNISLLTLLHNLKVFSDAKDIERLQNFYESTKHKILKKDEDTAENFYFAYLYYAKSEYNKCLQYCARIKPEISQVKLRIKALQIKCYFELGEVNAFTYTLDAYRQLLYRADFINERIKNYTKNFLNSINSLFDYKYFQKGILSDIQFEISKNNMPNKEWITMKMEAIK